jgi:hypothetical protein
MASTKAATAMLNTAVDNFLIEALL